MKISANNLVIVVEESAFEGVKRIADTIASDIELVVGSKPVCTTPDKVDTAKNVVIWRSKTQSSGLHRT